MFASGAASSLDLGRILLDLCVILCVAKLVAEIAERIGVPAVLGEIVAGIAIGPSALGIVSPSDTLFVLAELGAILLLLQVGMEIDLAELRTVGGAAMGVAVIGVALPLLFGTLGGIALGEESRTAIFIGATLTATSVGITARVFGDLRALSTKEARIVLGAAVADDVLGLIILTVVTRVVEKGTIGVGTIASTSALAISFLLISGAVGFTALPKIMGMVLKKASSPAAASVVALGITFGFASAADAAHLAPIIGAFVAGTALGRSPGHERVARDMSALGAIFVPIFFLEIGIDTDIASMVRPKVLGVAAILVVIAIATKLVAGVAARSTGADTLLIGLGMIPRGEVGLIFATIGLGVGVFDDDLHAAMVLVVLTTTVVAPALLRWRINQGDSTAIDLDISATSEPVDGWLIVRDGAIELSATPPTSASATVLLQAAALATENRPGEGLLQWVSERRLRDLEWDRDATTQLLRLLRVGSPRSWRLVEVSGLFERSIPEIAEAIRRRGSDVTELDPTHSLRFPTVEALREFTAVASSQSDTLLLAAFLADIGDMSTSINAVLQRLDLDILFAKEVEDLLTGAALLRAGVEREPHRVDERLIGDIAHSLKRPGVVERSRLLADAQGGLKSWQHAAMIDITTGVQEVLAHPELLSGENDSLAELRRRQASELTTDPALLDRIAHAPTTYVLAYEPAMLLDHAQLIEPAPHGRKVRVSVQPTGTAGQYVVNVACRNRKGLLSRLSGVLADQNISVVSASLATWPDNSVLDTFTVRAATPPSPSDLEAKFAVSLRGKARPRKLSMPAPQIALDNSIHPWHSVLRVNGPDQLGLLSAISFALSSAGVQVHHAVVQTKDGFIDDEFEISDRVGHKIDDARADVVRRVLQRFSPTV